MLLKTRLRCQCLLKTRHSLHTYSLFKYDAGCRLVQRFLSGLYPVYRTTNDTSTSPTIGNGTITDNSGSSWSYTYQGTTTSTTTTTQQTALPYTDTTLS